MPGTATGEHFRTHAEDKSFCWRKLRTQCFFVEIAQNILESVALAPDETSGTSFRARQDTYSVVRKTFAQLDCWKSIFYFNELLPNNFLWLLLGFPP